jgi:hypothetical protein
MMPTTRHRLRRPPRTRVELAERVHRVTFLVGPSVIAVVVSWVVWLLGILPAGLYGDVIALAIGVAVWVGEILLCLLLTMMLAMDGAANYNAPPRSATLYVLDQALVEMCVLLIWFPPSWPVWWVRDRLTCWGNP